MNTSGTKWHVIELPRTLDAVTVSCARIKLLAQRARRFAGPGVVLM